MPLSSVTVIADKISLEKEQLTAYVFQTYLNFRLFFGNDLGF